MKGMQGLNKTYLNLTTILHIKFRVYSVSVLSLTFASLLLLFMSLLAVIDSQTFVTNGVVKQNSSGFLRFGRES